MEDFQFGDTLAVEVFQPRLFFLEVGGEGVVAGHPAVAFAEQADEERAAGADFVEAELESLQLPLALSLGIGGLDPDAQLNRLEPAPARAGPSNFSAIASTFLRCASLDRPCRVSWES